MVGWLIVTGRLRPSPDYLVACRPYLGEVAAHHHRSFHERFVAASAELGFDPVVTRLQWSALAKVAALAGLTPERLTQPVIEAQRKALTAAITRHRPGSHGAKALSAALFGAQTTLFHLGVLDTAPRKTNPDRSAERAAAWAAVPPRLAATLTGYIAQTRLSLRPSTMVRVEGVLREFACWLAVERPRGGLRRRPAPGTHRGLQAAPGHPALGPRRHALTKTSLAEHLGTLRTCFDRLTEWDGDDIPARVLVFSGDLPLRDDPLPRFLDDAAFTKLLQAARADRRPVRPTVRGVPRPHRPAQGRIPRSHRRFRRADRRRVLAARAARASCAPTATSPCIPQLKDLLDDWLAARPSQPAQPLPVRRARPTHRRGPRRPGRRQGRRERPGSATSRPIACGTPWPPRRSTAACPSKPSPRFLGTDRCG